MTQLTKHTENRTVHYLVPLGKAFDDHPGFLDATNVISEAIRQDRHHGYAVEDGPRYAIEKQRAEDYAKFVAEFAQTKNYHWFSTHRYEVIVSPMSEAQIDGNRKSRRRD